MLRKYNVQGMRSICDTYFLFTYAAFLYFIYSEKCDYSHVSPSAYQWASELGDVRPRTGFVGKISTQSSEEPI